MVNIFPPLINYSKLHHGDKVTVTCSHRGTPDVVTTIKRISPKNGLITLNDVYDGKRSYIFKHFDKYGTEMSDYYMYTIVGVVKN